jgi:hypothetical protein
MLRFPAVLPAALLALLATAGPAGGSAEHAGVREALGELSAGSAAGRARAERWLGVHLGGSDGPLVVEAAQGADAEVRGRLVRVLSSDPRHLGLAAALAVEPGREARTVGEAALAELVLAWEPALAGPAITGSELDESLGEVADDVPLERLRLRLDAPLEGAAGRLDRLVGLAPLVVDDELDGAHELVWTDRAQRIVPGPAAEGTAVELLPWLARVRGLGLEGHGAGEEGGVLFHRLCPRRRAGRETGVEVLTSWCAALAGDESAERRGRAAVALGASGWPAATRWLEERWLAHSDGAALLGLLAAAGRGRMTGSLVSEAQVRTLVDRATAPLEAGAPADEDVRLAQLALHALRAASPLGPDGGDLSEVILEGWERAGDAALWWRLAAVEGQASGSPAVCSAVEEVLAREDLPPALTRVALGALGALPGVERGARVGAPEALAGSVRGPEDLARVADALARAGAVPPEAWAEPGAERGVRLEGSGALLPLAWWFRAGETGPAAAHLVALDGPDDAAGVEALLVVADLLRTAAWRGEGGRADAVLARARPAAGETADRLALLAGRGAALDAAAREAVLAGTEGRLGALCLGAAGALEEGGPGARDELVRRLAEALREDDEGAVTDLLAGATRCAQDLLERRLDVVAVGLVGKLNDVLEAAAERSAAMGVTVRIPWPPEPRMPVRDLDAEDRGLDRALGELAGR